MGRSVDGYMYHYDKLVQACMQICNTTDKATVQEILLECGVVEQDIYIILNNELWEGVNPYFAVSIILEQVFDLNRETDIFFNIFIRNNELKHGSLVNAIDAEDYAELVSKYREKLGKDSYEYEDEEYY